MLKAIVGIILFILAVSFALFLMPLVIGIFIAVLRFSSGNIIGGIIAIILGILIEFFWLWIMYNVELPTPGEDEDCPFCGGDSDGNHCYTCEEDF